MFKVNNKDTRTMPTTLLCCLFLLTLNIFLLFFLVFLLLALNKEITFLLLTREYLGLLWQRYTDLGHIIVWVPKIKSVKKSKTSFTNMLFCFSNAKATRKNPPIIQKLSKVRLEYRKRLHKHGNIT